MTAFILKLIAIISMAFDHISFIFYGADLSWMRFIGRISFPIFAFQICEGYLHTHDLNKYITRLSLFALISEIPYILFSQMFLLDYSLNVIFTLILGLLAITVYDTFNKLSKTKSPNVSATYNTLGILLVFLISYLSFLLKCDYGYYGVLLIFIFYLFRNKKVLMNIFYIILTILYYVPYFMLTKFNTNFIISFLFTLIPLIFINLYNGKKGAKFKYLFYIFYPIHLLIICLIYKLI